MLRQWKWWDTTLKDPQAYTSLLNMVPNDRGNYETARVATVPGSGAATVTGTVINADAIQKTDGTTRLFAATASKIYEVTGSATDRSRGAGTYTLGTFWGCAQYGDVTIYTNRADNVQASTSGAFADLAGTPPKARYVCTQSLAVALAAYNDGVNTFEDGVWFSDVGDHTTWTPSASNQAANLRLLQSPGAITAIVAFGGSVIAFKANSVYRLSYVGRPIIWQSQLLTDQYGAAGPGAVCVCGNLLVFGGYGGWFAFDGQSFIPLAPIANTSRVITQAPLDPSVCTASYYESGTGQAHFSSTGSSSQNPAVLAFQLQRGPGFGFAGGYAVTDGSSNLAIRAFVRGSPAALIGVFGIAANSLFSASAFVASGTNSAAMKITATWGQSGNMVTASLTTSYFGDPEGLTAFSIITPVLGAAWGTGAPFSGAASVSAQERSDLTDTGTTVNAVQAPSARTAQFFLTLTCRFAAITLSTTAQPMEVVDILVPGVRAGKN